MPEVQVHELEIHPKDAALRHAAKGFKNYCSIRRDLRNANQICEYVIRLRASLIAEEISLDTVGQNLFLVRASVMHAILLYSRWFKATNGKPTLEPSDFFGYGSSELSIHNKIIEHRDRYVAHNELDLLGSDRVWITTDDTGKFTSSRSDWLDQQWLQDRDLNMSTFQQCIHIVHNKIDAEILPKIQRKMDKRLTLLLGTAP